MEIESGIVCPLCGGEIEWVDCYDTEMCLDRYICRCIGTCIKCKENIEYNIEYPLSTPIKIIVDHYKE